MPLRVASQIYQGGLKLSSQLARGYIVNTSSLLGRSPVLFQHSDEVV